MCKKISREESSPWKGLSEERNNLQKAYEFKVFEFFLERLRKRDGSDPARACMLKILECLARTGNISEVLFFSKFFQKMSIWN